MSEERRASPRRGRSPPTVPPAARRGGPEGSPRRKGKRRPGRLEGGRRGRVQSAVPQQGRRGPTAPSGRQGAAGSPAGDGCGKTSPPRPTRGSAAKVRRRRLDDGGLRAVFQSGFPGATACGVTCGATDRARPVCRMIPRCAGRRPPYTAPTLWPSRSSRPGSSGRWSARHAVPSGAPSPLARQPRVVFLQDHSAPSRLLAICSRSHPFNSDSSQPTVRRLSRIDRGKSPRATSARIDLCDRPVRASTSGIRRMRGDASGHSSVPRDITLLPHLPGGTSASGRAGSMRAKRIRLPATAEAGAREPARASGAARTEPRRVSGKGT